MHLSAQLERIGFSTKAILSLDSRVTCPRLAEPSSCLERGQEHRHRFRESIFTNCSDCIFLFQEAVNGFRLLANCLDCTAPLVPGSVFGVDPASRFQSNFELAGRRLQSSHNFLALLDCSHFDIGLSHVWDISCCLRGLSLPRHSVQSVQSIDRQGTGVTTVAEVAVKENGSKKKR